ncbi:PaaI family thioesterase [Macrococcus hajekii]|uniref:PaaI family thioesterase n=1 Tax=Macrococcus hajekii TaxID=198482 RepID=A0A4R6BP85_9STAP|nr:PaaI family thioesterase [Macrococcus hajekii]TDM03477.1 PaaI family thioesterase [Macrococcus hajekii]GGA99181.1 thioesterase [Macrococcus hajekii]
MDFKALLERDSLLSHFDMKLQDLNPGQVTLSMPVTDKVRQPFGYLHGGATVALCETAASIGATGLIDISSQIAFGLEINANHIASVKEGTIYAAASIIHQGSATQVWEVRVTDDSKRLVSIARCTMAVKEKVR